MYFDNRSFGLTDIAIATTIAEKLDNGEPKPSLLAGLRRLLGRNTESTSQAHDQERLPASPEPVQNWR